MINIFALLLWSPFVVLISIFLLNMIFVQRPLQSSCFLEVKAHQPLLVAKVAHINRQSMFHDLECSASVFPRKRILQWFEHMWQRISSFTILPTLWLTRCIRMIDKLSFGIQSFFPFASWDYALLFANKPGFDFKFIRSQASLMPFLGCNCSYYLNNLPDILNSLKPNISDANFLGCTIFGLSEVNVSVQSTTSFPSSGLCRNGSSCM